MAVSGPIRGLNYGPFRDGENPNDQTFPTQAELGQDVAILAQVTRSVRLFSTANGFDSVIPLGAAAGLQVIPGAFLSGRFPGINAGEISSLVRALNTYNSSIGFPFAVVGTEAVSEQKLG